MLKKVPSDVQPNFDVNCDSKIITMRLLFTALACLINLTYLAQCDVYYVTSNASENGLGTQESPFSLTKAFQEQIENF